MYKGDKYGAGGGLTIEGWMICIAFGLGSNIINFFLKFLDESKFFKEKQEAEDSGE